MRRPLPIFKIQDILYAHNIPYYIQDDRIYAATMEASSKPLEHVQDLTGFTRPELFAWLGY